MTAMAAARKNGLTIALRVGDTSEAVAFYSQVLDRAPDYIAHDDFHEWEICPGAWLQLSSGHTGGVAASSRLRFEVDDIATEIERLRALGITVADATTLPEVVVFTDFVDPWGNRLGLYQDIAGPDGPPEIGGSAADEGNFVRGIAINTHGT